MPCYTGLQDYRFTFVMYIDMSLYDQYTLVYRITGLHCYHNDIHVSLYHITIFWFTGLQDYIVAPILKMDKRRYKA